MAGSSNMMMLVAVIVMCSSCASCAMSVMGPMLGMGNMFGGLFSGAGKAFKGPSLKKVGTLGSALQKLCNECKGSNWQGVVGARIKTQCADHKQACIDHGMA